MNRKAKLKKYWEYCYTKLSTLIRQKTWRSDGVRVKYMCRRAPKSDVLVVVFSAFTRPGLKARYNYMRTLNPLPVNRLFVLDDFAADRRGCYYLGEYPDFPVERAVRALIAETARRTGARKVIFCGSSKGGWSALNFGLQSDAPEVVIVSGAPQYLLGNYARLFRPTIECLCGTADRDTVIAALNEYLPRRVTAGPKGRKITVYLHYSDREHHYQEHIAVLLDDLKAAGFPLIEDRCDYVDHGDVSYYFPKFLVASIRREIEQPPR